MDAEENDAVENPTEQEQKELTREMLSVCIGMPEGASIDTSAGRTVIIKQAIEAKSGSLLNGVVQIKSNNNNVTIEVGIVGGIQSYTLDSEDITNFAASIAVWKDIIFDAFTALRLAGEKREEEAREQEADSSSGKIREVTEKLMNM